MESPNVKDHKLRHVAPFIYWISWGYVCTNQLIGLGLYHTPTQVLHYSFVTGFFNAHFYGVIFMLMGIVGAAFLLANSWNGVRRIMMFGLTVKALFFYGLLLNISWQALSILGIWSLITLTQFLTVVYFPKVQKYGFIR